MMEVPLCGNCGVMDNVRQSSHHFRYGWRIFDLNLGFMQRFLVLLVLLNLWSQQICHATVPRFIIMSRNFRLFDTSQVNNVLTVEYEDVLILRCHVPLSTTSRASSARVGVIRTGRSAVTPGATTIKNENEKNREFYKLYWVTEEGYRYCRTTEKHRQQHSPAFECSNRTTSDHKLEFKGYSAVPALLDFDSGKTYYLISTSTGSLDGLENKEGGACEHHNIKIKISIKKKAKKPIRPPTPAPPEEPTDTPGETSSSKLNTNETSTGHIRGRPPGNGAASLHHNLAATSHLIVPSLSTIQPPSIAAAVTSAVSQIAIADAQFVAGVAGQFCFHSHTILLMSCLLVYALLMTLGYSPSASAPPLSSPNLKTLHAPPFRLLPTDDNTNTSLPSRRAGECTAAALTAVLTEPTLYSPQQQQPHPHPQLRYLLSSIKLSSNKSFSQQHLVTVSSTPCSSSALAAANKSSSNSSIGANIISGHKLLPKGATLT